jgi:hypothetical protein
MLRSLRVVLVLGLGLVIAQGCMATPQDLVNDHDQGGGTTQNFDVTLDEGFEIAKAVFRWSGADLVEEHRPEKYLLTEIPQSTNFGALCGAWFVQLDGGALQVTVLTRKRNPGAWGIALTESAFLKEFTKAADLLHTTKQLPAKKPN